MKVLAISGSLRARSSNTAALEAARRLTSAGWEVEIYRSLGVLPHFNPDLEKTLPNVVDELRKQVGRADAILLSTPEYAHGLPGSFKNLLDWLVGSLEFPGKAIGVINTSPRSHHAQDQLVEVLTTMSARLVPDALATLPLLGRSLTAEQIAADPELSPILGRALKALARP